MWTPMRRSTAGCPSKHSLRGGQAGFFHFHGTFEGVKDALFDGAIVYIHVRIEDEERKVHIYIVWLSVIATKSLD